MRKLTARHTVISLQALLTIRQDVYLVTGTRQTVQPEHHQTRRSDTLHIFQHQIILPVSPAVHVMPVLVLARQHMPQM
jgi:hypothetical protein